MHRTRLACNHGQNMRMKITWGWFLLWVAAIQCAAASGAPPPVLNTYTVSSASGEYALTVTPSDIYGRGPADYHFTQNGKPLWESHLPSTLWEATVSDSGHVAGYAYTHGFKGFSKAGYDAGPGHLVWVILAPDGTSVFQEQQLRERSTYLGGSPIPQGLGVLVNDFTRQALFRMSGQEINERREIWGVHNVDTGEHVAKRHIGREKEWVVKVSPIPGTPLILTHSWTYDGSKSGARFTLVDKSGTTVWSTMLKDDYSRPFDEKEEDALRNTIREHGAILSVGNKGFFDLHFVKAGQRVSFVAAETKDHSWTITEIAREAYSWPTPEEIEPAAVAPELVLNKLGQVTLEVDTATEEHPIHDVMAFDFDSEGNICALQTDWPEPPSLLYLSPSGELFKNLPFPITKDASSYTLSGPAHVGGRQFVISVSGREPKSATTWYRADFRSGQIAKIGVTKYRSVKAITGFSDGRFAALTTLSTKYGSVTGLTFYNAKAQMVWLKETNGFSGEPDELLSPEDVIRYGNNQLAVLDNIMKSIQVFDLDGTFQRSIDLERMWKRGPNYPTDFSADHNDGFLIYDFNAAKNLVRTDADGKIVFEGRAKLKDGRPLKVYDGFKRSPQGKLWTCDGDVLACLSDQGVVQTILGQEAEVGRLTAPGLITVGPDDRVYIADRRTRSLHVFDPLGQQLGTMTAAPEELTETSSVGHVAVSPQGEVFVAYEDGSGPYLTFDQNFQPVSWAKTEEDLADTEWYFQPANDLCWMVDYHDVFLVRGLNEIVRTVSRRADGRWLEHPYHMAVGPDGSFAVAAQSGKGEYALSLYSPQVCAIWQVKCLDSFSIVKFL